MVFSNNNFSLVGGDYVYNQQVRKLEEGVITNVNFRASISCFGGPIVLVK